MRTEEIEKSFQEIWRLFKDTDKKFKETDKEIEKTSKTVKETSKAVYALTGKWSKFVEGLIVPAVEKLFKERRIKVDTIYQRVKRHKNGHEIEIDILAINGRYAVLIEAKSTLKIEDINDHIERLQQFKAFFPEYSNRHVIGAIGGISIEEESDKYAYRKGLFVIAEKGESVKILNDKKFKPKKW